MDFNVSFSQSTGFGSINAAVSGTYLLGRSLKATAADPFVSDIDNASRFSMKASIGASIGDFTTSVSVNRSGGYDLVPASAATRFPSMNHIGSFTTVDLFFQYDLKGESAFVSLGTIAGSLLGGISSTEV